MIPNQENIITINWDYDSLENSLRRGYLRDYNFYMIFLDRKKDYWRNIDPQGTSELFYIGSTRLANTSKRLLNNHEGLEMALREGFGDIHIALGYWEINSDSISVRQINDLVRFVESALIYHYMPTKNKVNRMNFNGPSMAIQNNLRSYGGLLIRELVINQFVNPVDSLDYSDISQNYIVNYFNHSPDRFEDGIIQLLGRIEIDISQLNDELIV